jgi:hypothetical protein
MLRVGLREVRRISGRIYVHFSDKSGLEFNNAAELRAFALAAEEDQLLLKRLLLAYWLKRDDGTHSALIEGKTVTLDLAGPTLLDVR